MAPFPQSSSPSPLQESWTRVAEEYHRHIAPGLRSAATAMCRAVKIVPSDRVLDIACGPGTAAFEARVLGARCILGIDFALGMVARARGVARAEICQDGSSGVYFAQASALALPVRSGAIDVAISNFGAVFAPDPSGVVVEVARALKPGGRLGLTAWPRAGAVGAYYDLVDRHIVPEPSAYDPHDWARPEYAAGWLATAFDHIATAPLSLPFAAPSPEEAWQILRSSTGRVSNAYAALDQAARRRMDSDLVGFFSALAGPGGVHWEREALLITAVRR